MLPRDPLFQYNPYAVRPVFASLQTTLDTTGGVTVATLQTFDENKPDDSFLYSIKGGVDADSFSINENRLVFDAGVLDKDQKASYEAAVTSTDSEGKSFTYVFYINVVEVDTCQQGCQVYPPNGIINSNWEITSSTYDPLSGDWTLTATARQAVATGPDGMLISSGNASAILTDVTNVASWNGGGYTGNSSYAQGETITFTGTSNLPNINDAGGCDVWSFDMTGATSTEIVFKYIARSCSALVFNSFNGTDNLIVLPTDTLAMGTDSWEIKATVITSDASTTRRAVTSRMAGSNGTGVFGITIQYFPNGQWVLDIEDDNTNHVRCLSAQNQVTNNKTYNITASFDNTTGTARLVIPEANSTDVSQTNAAMIGGNISTSVTESIGGGNSGGASWQGQIYDVQISRNGTPTNNWGIRDGSGTLIRDSVGSADATLQGDASNFWSFV